MCDHRRGSRDRRRNRRAVCTERRSDCNSRPRPNPRTESEAALKRQGADVRLYEVDVSDENGVIEAARARTAPPKPP